VTERILVTGGAGFIGSHVVDALVARGRKVTVLDDFTTGDRANLAEAARRGDVDVVQGSVLDDGARSKAIAGCGAVFHLAVQCVRRSLGQPLDNHAVNATGTLRTLEAARRARIRRFVYVSSSEVYGNCGAGPLSEHTRPLPVTVYGAAKLAGEHYALAYRQTYGLPAVVVRPFNAYGPREHERGDLAEVIPRFVIRALNGMRPVIFGDGKQGRDFTYVTETAEGIVAAADCDAMVGGVANIAFGRMIAVGEVAAAVARACGRPELTPEYLEARPGDVAALWADTAHARSLFGFSAKIAFEDGLQRYVQWFRRRHPDPSAAIENDIRNWSLPPTAESRP
jgi:UDP-glucose 4-epimerase